MDVLDEIFDAYAHAEGVMSNHVEGGQGRCLECFRDHPCPTYKVAGTVMGMGQAFREVFELLEEYRQSPGYEYGTGTIRDLGYGDALKEVEWILEKNFKEETDE